LTRDPSGCAGASWQSFCTTPNDEAQCVAEAANLLETIGIPLGWSAPTPQDGIWGWPLKVLGLLISVAAATLGAPFLVSGLGQDRNATQYRPTTTAGLLSQSRLQGARHCNVRHPKTAIGVEIGQTTPFGHPKTGNVVAVWLANRVRRHGRCTSPRPPGPSSRTPHRSEI
jgi:hypothetical protein